MPLTREQRETIVDALEESARLREMLASQRDPKENERLRQEAAYRRELAKGVRGL
jgi:hypothetical protein